MNVVSIIVPVYNGQDYIEKCINSLMAQTYEELEIIIIDDGSTDNTGNICKKYTKTPKVHYHKITNHGPAYARNYGLEVASGEWIMFVDSDDMVNSDICAILKKKADQYNADMVFCNLKNIYTEKADEELYPFGFGEKVYERHDIKFIEYSLVSKISDTGDSLIALSGPVCKLIKKNIISSIQFPNNISLGEDTCFVLQIVRRCERIVYIPQVLYDRNVIYGSLSNGCKNEDVRLAAYTNWIIDFYKNEPEMKKAVNNLIAHNLRKIVYDYLGRESLGDYTSRVKHVKNYYILQRRKLLISEVLFLDIGLKAKIVLLLAKFKFYLLINAIYH